MIRTHHSTDGISFLSVLLACAFLPACTGAPVKMEKRVKPPRTPTAAVAFSTLVHEINAEPVDSY